MPSLHSWCPLGPLSLVPVLQACEVAPCQPASASPQAQCQGRGTAGGAESVGSDLTGHQGQGHCSWRGSGLWRKPGRGTQDRGSHHRPPVNSFPTAPELRHVHGRKPAMERHLVPLTAGSEAPLEGKQPLGNAGDQRPRLWLGVDLLKAVSLQPTWCQRPEPKLKAPRGHHAPCPAFVHALPQSGSLPGPTSDKNQAQEPSRPTPTEWLERDSSLHPVQVAEHARQPHLPAPWAVFSLCSTEGAPLPTTSQGCGEKCRNPQPSPQGQC